MKRGLAVVTGASSGIGWEMAKQLAARGYDLLLVARREDRLKELAALIEAGGQTKAGILRLDLTIHADRQRLAARLAAERDQLSVVVNSAGFGAVARAIDVPVGRTLDMIELNAAALTELSLEAAKIFAARRSGAIINVASTAAFQPVPYMSVYAATKAYVLSFTEALAEELRGTGVRVMALCPGYTDTEFQRVAGERADSARLKHMMSAADCVRLGLRDFEAGRRVTVTGMVNKIQAAAGRHFPRGIVVRAAGLLLKTRMR